MSMARISIIRLKETPKFLVGEGKDAECVEVLQGIATKHNRPCSLTLEALQACGTISTRSSQGKSKWGLGGIGTHLKGLYATKRIGISTTLIWLSWTLIGLAYPLYVPETTDVLCVLMFRPVTMSSSQLISPVVAPLSVRPPST